MECPLCYSPSSFAFPAKGINVLDCNECDHRFAQIEGNETFVEEVYDDSYFNGGGAGYANYTVDARLLVHRGRMYADKISKYTEPGTMIDVGAACGYILKGFTDKGWSGIGLEPNLSMARQARERLNLTVLQGTLESCFSIPAFDLLTMIQVIGHFYDPVKAFEKARDLLNDDGLILIEGWNRESISARAFGRRWHEYSPPSVLQWFSPKSLTRLLDGLGFDRLAGGRPSKRISGRHAKSLLKYSLGESRVFDLIPNKLTIPYPSEDLFWALYRKRKISR
jgi:SAM-dependent methyltransferase